MTYIHSNADLLAQLTEQIEALAPIPAAQQDPDTARKSAIAQVLNIIEVHKRAQGSDLRQPADRIRSTCQRCRQPTQEFDSPWCANCHYPGIDEDYAEFVALINEGHSRPMAAVLSGWLGIEEVMENEEG